MVAIVTPKQIYQYYEVMIYQSLLILHTFYQKMSLRMVIPVANSFASGIN